jgi:protein TonB
MPPISKDSDTLTARPESASRSASVSAPSTESAPKQQAVALEIPVTANGARTVEGSNKREPFSETTKTVLVFGAGAVIRLTSSVAPGQLLFLTNERTKKEVVCQVVKSKNYRNVSGYVELQFTEPAVGFWGMRFPGDGIGSASQPAPARPTASSGSQIPARPGSSKIGEPLVSSAPSNGATKPMASTPAPPASPSIVPPAIDSAALLSASKPKTTDTPVPTAPAAPVLQASPKSTQAQSLQPISPVFDVPRDSDKPASLLASSPQLSGPPTVDLSSIAPFFEVKPSASSTEPPPPQVQVPIDPETEKLKHQTARLQEEFSRMNFAEPASDTPVVPPEAPSFPLVEKDPVHESAAQILEPSKEPLSAPILLEPEPLESVKAAPAKPAPSLNSLEQEELKIPSWLEPLARNTAAPSSTKELVLREKAKRLAEQEPDIEGLATEPSVPVEEVRVSKPRIPEFSSALPMDEEREFTKSPSKRPERALLYGAIAAGIMLLAAGGWWYMNQQSIGARASVSPMQVASDSVPATSLQTKPTANATKEANHSSPMGPASSPSTAKSTPSAAANSALKLPVSGSASSSSAPIRNTKASSKLEGNSGSLDSGKIVSSPSSAQPTPTPEEVKKPTLGAVRLATPKISRSRNAHNGTEAEAGLSLDDVQPETGADALNSGLAVGNKQPAAPTAPLAVGGDVKQAKLMSSVPPVYPPLAKTQHVSGNVVVDALIDATGRVTTMKVMSGPTLLHQAAMDALKQWKYQPAMLDGKAVPMHLTVTIQFRLQ